MATTNSQMAKSNGNAREEIIASIRRNLLASKPFDAVRLGHHTHDALKHVVHSAPTTEADLIDLFCTNLRSVGGICTIVADETEAAEKVAETIRSIGANRIAISDSEIVESVINSTTEFEFVRNADAAELFDSDLGITSAQWAIAETGTLVLESERESHRLTSLVPSKHLCILKARTIRQTLGEILELTSQDLSRTVTFITGASRTSDIELTLAIGVHGPKELHVIILANQ